MNGPGRPDLGAMWGARPVDTFMGVPAARPDAPGGARVALIGAPGATPYPSVGPYCAQAPGAIRAASAPFAPNAGHVNFDLGRVGWAPGAVVDCGDLAFDADDFAANRARIGAAVTAIAEAGAVPVILGGDDSVPIPAIAALAARGALQILQIDAHIDWRDEVGGERWGLSSTMRRASEVAGLRNIVQVGARGIGSAHEADRNAARDWGARLIPAAAFLASGLAAAVEALLPGVPLFLAFDFDALDPAQMPAVIARTFGGVSYAQAIGLIEAAAARAPIAGAALVELVPERDIDGMGVALAAQLAAFLCGLIAGR